jgi:hypothetical protein
MTHTQAVFDTETLLGFVKGFGEGVDDLRCTISDMNMKGVVDVASHYFEKKISISHAKSLQYNYTPGVVCIPDVHKLTAFLKSCDDNLTFIRHVGNMLTVSNGNQRFSTPTHDNVLSYQTVDRATTAINQAKKNSWKKLGRAELQFHATATMSDLQGLGSMTKVVAKDSPVRIKMEDSQMVITAGSKRGATMSRTIEIDELTQGVIAETVFASQLPKLLSIMPSGEVTLRMGHENALIVEHNDLAALLILKHQEGME